MRGSVWGPSAEALDERRRSRLARRAGLGVPNPSHPWGGMGSQPGRCPLAAIGGEAAAWSYGSAMRATLMYGAGDVRVETVPDARLIEPTDALVRVRRAGISGSDLWPYKSMPHDDAGRRMGHEFIGVIEAVGADVETVKVGDQVVSPFLWSDGSCVFCREGLHSECLHGGRYGWADVDGGQGEAVRVPQADGTLVVLPVGVDEALMPSLLTLTDVMGTGHHAAVAAGVGPGKTVAVVGDGAVGLCGVIASKRLGAERIILLGSNPERTTLGEEFGATDVVRERGEEAVERVRELTERGAHSVLECVGLEQAVETALEIVRPGGAVGRVGVPENDNTPTGVAFWKNASLAGGPAPVRAYIEELLPDVLEGRIEPGRVFDRFTNLDGVPDGYRAMNEREVLKVIVEP
jgi:threonine dehydrogenase-like Zn-dependent dehydrogenase